jgi:hypothetical protein
LPALRPSLVFQQKGPASAGATPYPADGFVASAAANLPTAKALSSAPALVAAEPPSVDIKFVQDQLTANLPGVDVQFANIDAFAKLNGRLATMGELREMMSSLYDESSIPYGYITDGCYSRAHMMDESFRQHGINNAKMFCKGDLEAKNDLMTARWWYHVAPLVFVDGGDGKPVPKIIDPGFSREPMDPEQWVLAMNKGPSVEIDLVSAEQYYPRDGAPDDDFAASLGPSIGTAQSYSLRLHGIKKAKGIPVPPYSRPTWDKPNSNGDFVVGGETKYLWPEGIQTSKEPAYRLNTSLNGTITMEPVPEKEKVSARWDKRPAGAFDPYSAK